MLSGRNKAELRGYFEKAGVPWIYDKERPEVHMNSTYNRRPKTTKMEADYEVRIATIRKNLSTQDEKLEKLRAERIQNKPLVGYDRTIMAVLKALAAADTEAKRLGTKAVKAVATEDGLTTEAKPGVKKGKVKGVNSSKAGSISKKDREVVNITRNFAASQK